MTTQTELIQPGVRAVAAFEAGRRLVESGEIDLERLAGLVCTAEDAPHVRGHVRSMLPALVVRYGEAGAVKHATDWAAATRKAAVRSARRKR